MDSKIMTDTEFLINDFKENPVQSSWDFEADLRFAKAIGNEEAVDLLMSMSKSNFMPGILANFHHVIRPQITRRRLKTTRKLVKQGLVIARWSGTGYGGKANFGVSRTRSYCWKAWHEENAVFVKEQTLSSNHPVYGQNRQVGNFLSNGRALSLEQGKEGRQENGHV